MFEGPQQLPGLTLEAIAKKRAYKDVRPKFTISTYLKGMNE